MSMQTHEQTHIGMHCISCSQAILAEGAIALPVTLSGGALFALHPAIQVDPRIILAICNGLLPFIWLAKVNCLSSLGIVLVHWD